MNFQKLFATAVLLLIAGLRSHSTLSLYSKKIFQNKSRLLHTRSSINLSDIEKLHSFGAVPEEILNVDLEIECSRSFSFLSLHCFLILLLCL